MVLGSQKDEHTYLSGLDDNAIFFSIECLPDLAILLSFSGQILAINQPALKLYGWKKEDAQNANIFDLENTGNNIDLPIPSFFNRPVAENLPNTWKTVIRKQGSLCNVVNWSLSSFQLLNKTNVILLVGRESPLLLIDTNNTRFNKLMQQTCFSLMSAIVDFLEKSFHNKYTSDAIQKNIAAALTDLEKMLPFEVYCTDANNLYIFCNCKYEELYGLVSCKDLLHKSAHFVSNAMAKHKSKNSDWTEHIPNVWERTCDLVKHTGKPLLWHQDLDFKPFVNTGLCRPFTNKFPIIDDFGNILGVFGITVDGNDPEQLIKLQQVCKQFCENVLESQKSPLDKLTIRENECLGLIARGKSAKNIANELKISARTVETHVNNTMVKLNCHTRSNLVDLYWKYNKKDSAIIIPNS